jgi:hypothetical protein
LRIQLQRIETLLAAGETAQWKVLRANFYVGAKAPTP